MAEKQKSKKLPSERGHNYIPLTGGALSETFLWKVDDFAQPRLSQGRYTSSALAVIRYFLFGLATRYHLVLQAVLV